ncbi:hypothetical protein D3C81_1541680 [compost metagenome]
MRGADAVAFGHAVAGAGHGHRLDLQQALQQRRGCRAAAQAEGEQRLGAVEFGMGQQLLHHHRRAVELGAALFADGPQRLVHVPLVEDHQPPADAQGVEELRIQAADVEQRKRQQRRGREPRVDDRPDPLRRAHAGECALELQAVERLGHRMLARQHALGAAGGAGGVEDQRRIVRLRPGQLHRFQIALQQRVPAVHSRRTGSVHQQHLAILGQSVRHQLMARHIADQYGGARMIGET